MILKTKKKVVTIVVFPSFIETEINNVDVEIADGIMDVTNCITLCKDGSEVG